MPFKCFFYLQKGSTYIDDFSFLKVNASQQKRARTRITDDQLKILRAHFDINNSPSEDQIHEMAGQSGLPPKVIKHWFRNTLFKERQRNKDSPYNFNNPPSTTLNLEEYEKTGEAKVMPLNSSGSSTSTEDPATPAKDADIAVKSAPPPPPPPSPAPQQLSASPMQPPNKSGPQSSLIKKEKDLSSSLLSQKQTSHHHPHLYPFHYHIDSIKKEPREAISHHDLNSTIDEQKFNSMIMEAEQRMKRETVDEKPNMYHGQAMSPPSPHMSDRMNIIPARNNSPENLTLTSIISSQLGPDSMSMHSPNQQMQVSHSNMLPPKLTPPNFTSPNHMSSSGILTPTSRSISPARSGSADCFSHGLLSGQNGNNSGSSGKRANRTRFTDYQIKVLQEFFENNAYPKDDDLEYLSKLLNLSPRVIVVWFQNARQKARKVYENQPPVDPGPGIDDGAGRFQRTPGLNYQCKKCLLVFQRYYELIRHQKTHCFKEEDAKRSAQAQAAAAQIAAVLSSEDSNSSTIIEQQQSQLANFVGMNVTSSPSTPAPITPTPSQSVYPPSPVPSNTPTPDTKDTSFQCDNCNLVFPRFDLWREHQLVHIMNPNLFPTYPPDSPFGILQTQGQIQQHQQQQQLQPQVSVQQQHVNSNSQIQMTNFVADLSMNSNSNQHPLISMLTSNKRKFDEMDDLNERSQSGIAENEQPKDKRLRTTILPEQLDYLYQKYQIESNPSRKMLENIAREVGLKKRVVQVWFQNTRARERKGQFRAHSQVINKRCPFCPALFKVKSALESHLTTKHADQCSRGEINIDALPDEELSVESSHSFQTSQMGDSGSKIQNFGSSQGNQSMIPPLFPPFHGNMDDSFKKYYEDSLKRYINELQAQHVTHNGAVTKEGLPSDLRVKSEGNGRAGESTVDCPLDLSKPVDLSRPIKMNLDHDIRAIMGDPGPLTDLSERSFCDEDSMSECTDTMEGDESNPTSPASSTQSRNPGQGANKRYRTQMSSLQVKCMKSLFNDYKTPTMAECEMLGREIGLPKRVIQVWFQNARAKEKKNKLTIIKALGPNDNDVQRLSDECKLCQFKYSHKYSVQDHIFTKKHIDMVKSYLENRMSKSELSGNASDSEFTVPPVPVAGEVNHNNNNTTQQHQIAQLQMLQMAGTAMASKMDGKDPQQPSVEELALLHQLYALGFPQGYVQSAMLSSTGKSQK